MELRKFFYQEFLGTQQYWGLDDLELKRVNLIVGKNASGKTRTLNAIEGFARLLTSVPKIIFSDGTYRAWFNGHNNKEYYLEIVIVGGVVERELLLVDGGNELIVRSSDGTGQIWGEKALDYIEFKVPHNELVVCRRDELQHPYLAAFLEWATLVRRFHFTIEKGNLYALVPINAPLPSEFNLNETDRTMAVFARGELEFGEVFRGRVVNDFNSIGYEIRSISLGDMVSAKLNVPVPGAKVVGLRVQESDREGLTDQHSMSAGMLRALSIIVHFAYYELRGMTGCIMIDDIGEGLDFDRATKLIKLIISKAEQSSVQLILSSNDKFVMNNTDLKYWQVISRHGGQVSFYNEKNSQELFSSFQYTGLNNFDFFSLDLYRDEEK